MCTVAGARTLFVRDEQTGGKLWGETLQTDVENMLVGDTIIVTVPKNYKQGNTLCLLQVL